MREIDLKMGWKIRHEDLWWGVDKSSIVMKKTDDWMLSDLPCDVHMPLVENGIIPEPLEGDNASLCRWIEDKSWWFMNEFYVSSDVLESDFVELTLESLDSEADIFLNGIHVGHQKSAFYPFCTDVKKYLVEGNNTLLVRLTTGIEYFSENDISPIKKYVCTHDEDGHPDRGDKRRAFVRKPQYGFGWDWGPRVATCGIVKGAWLRAYNKYAIRSVHVVSRNISVNAELEFEIEIENFHPYSTLDSDLKVEILLEGKKITAIETEAFLRSGLNYIKVDAVIENPQLWWPNGMGGQTLYTVSVSANAEGESFLYPEFNYGIRTVRVLQNRIGQDERSFTFEVNGVKVYCKGANWIPVDSVYARIKEEKYELLINEAKKANFNMLRLWGGGLYERDIFYRKCDENGIMIWHDFMFSCASYPDNLQWFRDEVKKELDYQTRKLRNHTSIVVWCGNNENAWGYDIWSRKEGISGIYGGSECYNKIAPRIVQRNCPEIFYWNSSPYGGKEPNGNEAGGKHLWPDFMMNEDMEKRITPEEYDKVTAKFVAEYGYIGPCKKSSVVKYLAGAPIDRNSHVWQLHNNDFEKNTVAAGINKLYTDPARLDIDGYLLYAGLCQGIIYGYSLEAMRFNEKCDGSLFWMYSDCWGEVGWTIIDYYLARKISYYFVKRAFEVLKIIMRENNGKVKVMGINETSDSIKAECEYGYVSFEGKVRDTEKRLLEIAPYSRKVIFEFDKGSYDPKNGVIFVCPDSASGILPVVLKQLSFKEMNITKAGLQIDDFNKNGNEAVFRVKSDSYAHAVHFGLDDSIRLSDEYFDLLPGESRIIRVYNPPEGFVKDSIKLKCILNTK